jgi:beta-lactamase class A
MIKQPIFLLALMVLSLSAWSQSPLHRQLREQIKAIIKPTSGHVGVSIRLLETGDTVSVQNEAHYVMQSVFKLAIAMNMLHKVDQNDFKLQQQVLLTAADLPDNYSPIRDRYLKGNKNVTINDLLISMITLSDNDACDILLNLLGGPQNVEHYVHQLGIKQIAIRSSEWDMHYSWLSQYQNWCWPSAQTDLLEYIYTQRALQKNTNDLLKQWLLQTVVTPKRIKGLLPMGTLVGHRSGTSATNPQGLSPGTNDVGVILLPNGRHLIVSIFIMDSFDKTVKRELTIAKIAEAAYSEFTRRNN